MQRMNVLVMSLFSQDFTIKFNLMSKQVNDLPEFLRNAYDKIIPNDEKVSVYLHCIMKVMIYMYICNFTVTLADSNHICTE